MQPHPAPQSDLVWDPKRSRQRRARLERPKSVCRV